MQYQTAENIENQTRQEDLALWAGNWIWRAVQTLVESPDFNPSAKWIAQRLNITVEKAVNALDGLERLGILARVDNTYKTQAGWFQVGEDKLSSKQLLSAHASLAPQVLSKLKPDDKYTAQFFRGDAELLIKYAPKFIELYKQMDQEGKDQGLTEVIASQISFAVLTEDKSGGVQ